MTHCLGVSSRLINIILEWFAANLREEFLFEVILGIEFFCQPQGLELAKAPREGWHHKWWEPPASFMATGGFVCELSVEILMIISVWDGTTPNPQ